MPSKIPFPTLITLGVLFLAFVANTVRAEQRLADLEAFKAKEETRREVEAQALRRMEKILCRICDAQLGRENCNSICTE